MDSTFDCTIRSSDGPAFSGPARSVTLPTPTGEVEVLPGHAEAFIALAPGEAVVVAADGARRAFPIKGGVFAIKEGRGVAVL